MKKKMLGIAIAMVMAVGAFIPIAGLTAEPVAAAAKAPSIEEVSYEKGKIEVEFRNDVKYKKVKVYVKDSKGKKYSVYSIKKDSDEIEFKLKNAKNGVKYNFTIKGVKNRTAKKYTTVRGSVSAPAVSSAPAATIGLESAKSIALKHAGIVDIQSVQFEKARKDLDDGIYVYEIEFIYGDKEYDYEIHASSGKILDYDIESVWD